jgi:general secretion pathway protein G
MLTIRARTLRSDKGFTLVELMVVMLIIGILAAIAVPSYVSSIKSAREAVLREDLHVMREAIDSYTMDKDKAPDSLDDLVQAGYLKSIPKDPMTQSSTTWNTDSGDSYSDVDQTSDGGISNVHSGSTDTGTDNRPYSEW